MARTKAAPQVIGQDFSLLAFAVRQNPGKPSVDVVRRFRDVLASGMVSVIDRIPSSDRLIVAGTTALNGSHYHAEIWRGSDGRIVTVAREIVTGRVVRPVNRVRVVHQIREAILSDAVAEAVADAMDARHIDHHACWQLRDELMETVDEMVRSGDHNDIMGAAEQALEYLLQVPGSWAKRNDLTAVNSEVE